MKELKKVLKSYPRSTYFYATRTMRSRRSSVLLCPSIVFTRRCLVPASPWITARELLLVDLSYAGISL